MLNCYQAFCLHIESRMKVELYRVFDWIIMDKPWSVIEAHAWGMKGFWIIMLLAGQAFKMCSTEQMSHSLKLSRRAGRERACIQVWLMSLYVQRTGFTLQRKSPSLCRIPECTKTLKPSKIISME